MAGAFRLSLPVWAICIAAAGGQEEMVLKSPADTEHLMVLVPAGEFTMGSDRGEADERPEHVVHLDAFYCDKYEVTNAQYLAFMNATAAIAGAEDHKLMELDDSGVQIRSAGESFELKSAAVARRPVVEVSWHGAMAYCEWMGGRLPTEAEWEKAARGMDGRRYPWGTRIDRPKANYKGLFSTAVEVGSYPQGSSPYGICDMAGNVWEWVADWYSNAYYAESPQRNPTGPESGTFRIIRGGAWGTDGAYLRTSYRMGLSPESTDDSIGFRCARDAPSP